MSSLVKTKMGIFDIDEFTFDVIIDGSHHLCWLNDNNEFVTLEQDRVIGKPQLLVSNGWDCYAGVWNEQGFQYVLRLNKDGQFGEVLQFDEDKKEVKKLWIRN